MFLLVLVFVNVTGSHEFGAVSLSVLISQPLIFGILAVKPRRVIGWSGHILLKISMLLADGYERIDRTASFAGGCLSVGIGLELRILTVRLDEV